MDTPRRISAAVSYVVMPHLLKLSFLCSLNLVTFFPIVSHSESLIIFQYFIIIFSFCVIAMLRDVCVCVSPEMSGPGFLKRIK